MSEPIDQDYITMLAREAADARPGVLPPRTSFDSYLGHTVINISNTVLSPAQLSALEKGLTFCPTPGPPDKSQIWRDFKEFHRRLSLTQFLHTRYRNWDRPRHD